MFHHQAAPGARLRRRVCSARRDRRGVILLVVLAMLALFTMIGLTLVLSTSQARLSALSSTRGQSTSTPYQQLLSRAFHDTARGSTNKYSPIQAHSFLEDLYGSALLKGQVNGAPTMQGSGNLIQFVYATTATTNTVPNVLPNASHVFSGLVITMTSGKAAGRSARIVRDVAPNTALLGGIGGNNGGFMLTCTSFGDAVPKSGDEFVINGRPFSGTGFGFQYASFYGGNPIFQVPPMTSPPTTYKLDAMDPTTVPYAGGPLTSLAPKYLWPYALLPNHAHFTPQNPGSAIPGGGGWYTDPGGPGVGSTAGVVTTVLPRAAAAPGGANEPYDAPDYQNMFLAMHYFDVTSGKTLTPIPSFHRPELIAHWAQRAPGALAATTTPGSIFTATELTLQKELRRKIILRPDPNDQGFNAALQDMPNANGATNGVFDYREPFTDLDGNGQYTSGEPFLDLNADGFYSQGDIDFTGKRFNPITGPYYIYHNPTTNVETWVRDSLSDWDVDNDGDGQSDSIWIDLGYEPEPGPDGKLYKPLFAILCVDMDGKLNVNAHGSIAQVDPIRYGGAMLGPFASTTAASGSLPVSTGVLRNFQVGDGYGPPDVSLLPLLQRANPATALLYYQQLLQGLYNSGAVPPYYISGRYGEVDNPNIATPNGSNGYATNYLISGPMAGRTEQFDPYDISFPTPIYQVNDPLNQLMQSPLRPFLINYPPQQGTGYGIPPGYFFDFVTPQYTLTGTLHTPTGYGSPHNIHGRGAVLLDLRGQPYYAGSATLPWMLPLVNSIGVGSNSLVNDAVDDPYELDLSLRGQRDGLRVSANNVSKIDAPFTPEEIERILRSNDVDGLSLPSRLLDLAPPSTTLSSPSTRHALTSDSYDLPVPGVTATDAQQVTDLTTPQGTNPTYLQDIFNTGAAGNMASLGTSLGNMSLVDLARARIIARNPSWVTNYTMKQALQYADLALFGSQSMAYPAAAPTNAVQPLLSPEFLQGLRFDINRPLGDGVDNNGNGIVDEPAEVLASVFGDSLYYPVIDPTTGLTTYASNVNLDLNNDGYLPGDPLDMTFHGDMRARQLLARHLYVLMMLLIDDLNMQGQIFLSAPSMGMGTSPYVSPPYATLTTASASNSYNTANSTASVPAQQIAYFVAQWAINVVDFRDPDSICTPFEFDLSPFSDDDAVAANGTWDVNDVVHPTNGTVDPWTNQLLPGAGYTNDDTAAYRGIVFGCERPELLISEIGAFHDRGTDDTNLAADLTDAMGNPVSDSYYNDPAATTKDMNFDQVRRPKGSLIVELFNPNSPLNAPQTDMFQTGGSVTPGSGVYTGAAGAGAAGVNLTQVVQSGGVYSPVWRLAIAYSPLDNAGGYYSGAPANMATNPIDPRVPILPTTYIHRAVYFAPVTPTLNAVSEISKSRSFYVDPAQVALGVPMIVQPNSYALVGPGVVDLNNTSLGAVAALNFGVRNKSGDSTAGPNGKQNVYNMYAQMTNANAAVPAGLYNNYAAGSGAGGGGVGAPIPPYTPAGTPLTAQNIKPIVALPIATLYLDATGNPTVSATASTTLRMSVSEPELGYPVMTALTGASPYSTWDDSFYYLSGVGGGGAKYPNTPFDVAQPTNGSLPNTYAGPPDRTTVGYTTVYLQRLANPTAFWDPTANPYLTVDSMQVDLTTFTGEASPPSGGTANGVEPAAGGAMATAFAFEARSRGQFYSGVGSGEQDVPNIWSPASTNPTMFAAPSAPANPGTDYIPLQNSTLGFLNQTYWVTASGGTLTKTGNTTSPTGWQNGFYSAQMLALNTDPTAGPRLQAVSASTSIPTSQFWGDPLLPFPWLTWNNRPYVSQYEMMLVPASSPSTLLSDFGEYGYVYNNSTSVWNNYSSSATDPYNPPAGQTPAAATYAVPMGAFQHLLNFYDSTVTNGVLTTRTATPPPANFFRLFEYVHVPSRFTGTQTMLNPAQFAGFTSGQHTFHPPFNWISQYRDPGRVNLNTVYDPVVFQGLMDDFASWGTLWAGLVDSRRGFVGVTYNATTGLTAQWPYPALAPMVPNFSLYAMPGQPVQYPIYPSIFANPFRPEGAATLAPPYLSPPATYLNSSLVQPAGQSINATLLRATAPSAYPDVTIASGLSYTPKPQFDAVTYDVANTSSTYSATTGANARQAARNAYFNYQTQSRLGNLTTNRSNVYAIWITVGYFEAIPTLPSAANPDGYQIGSEKGSETGAFERHRAFYMFDRSVPMGFMRGEDLNVDNGILIERMIE